MSNTGRHILSPMLSPLTACPRLGTVVVVACALLGGACSQIDLAAEQTTDATATTSAHSTTTAAEQATTQPTTQASVQPTPEPEPQATSADPTEQDTGPFVGDSQSQSLVGELSYTVVAAHPHDATSFTQGLALADGILFESSGLYGQSAVSQYSAGDIQPRASSELADSEFGTGLDVVGEILIQLTWKEGTAHLKDLDTLETTSTLSYPGEGWGLCFDGTLVVTSDGTSTLSLRDPDTFDKLESVSVTRDGQPLLNLSELECVEGYIWANVWLTSEIVRIDPTTGEVVAWVDLSALVPQGLSEDDVLNGIAYSPDDDTYFVTGKRWSDLYQITIQP